MNKKIKSTSIANLKTLFSNTSAIMLNPQQFRNNQHLFSGHDINNLKLKGDGREVWMGFNIAGMACHELIIRRWLESSMNLWGFRISDLLNRYGVTDRVLEFTRLYSLNMVSAYNLHSEIVKFLGMNPASSKDFEKINPHMATILKIDGAIEELSKRAKYLESAYPKKAGYTRFVDTKINNEYLNVILEPACRESSRLIKEDIQRQDEMTKDLHDRIMLTFDGFQIVAHLKRMSRNEAIKFIQENIPILNEAWIEFAYDELIIKS